MRPGQKLKDCYGLCKVAEWYSNGDPVESVLVNDRGVQYGDGLFETIAIRGGEPRLWQYHMDRLAEGCDRLRIKMPAESTLSEGVVDALQQSAVPTGYCVVKIIVTAGIGLRGYGRARSESATLLMGVFPAQPHPVERYRDGVNTVLCRTRLASDSPTAGLKTLNRLEQVLARSEFAESGEFEGLTMDADDNIICGTMSNVFFVADNSISTPPLDRCGVKGVMRRHVIESLSEQDIGIQFKTLNLANLQGIQEVFVSNSQFGIMPVQSCADLRWPVGDTTRKIMSILADKGITECR